MSNFPLDYRLSWLPRLIAPSTGGDRTGLGPWSARLVEPAPPCVRIAFLGDLSAVANRGAPTVDPAIRETLAGADLVVANCESPVVARARGGPLARLGFEHAMDRGFLEATLEAAGIAPSRLVLSLANNHALDQGTDGFDETVATLSEMGIAVAGTVAGGAVRVSVGPLDVAFAAFTRWRNGSAFDHEGRVAMQEAMARDGWAALDVPGADLVCALPHWDREFRHLPMAETRAAARMLAGRGVGLVAGGHAHVLQPVERIGDAVVAYGLGDFLGTAWPRVRWPLRIGGMLVVDIGTEGAGMGKVAAYRLVPFFRLDEGGRERLVPVEALEGRLRARAETRLAAIGPATAPPA